MEEDSIASGNPLALFLCKKWLKKEKLIMQTLTLYHGSPKLFSKFDERTIQRGDFGYGFYLTTDSKTAQKYSGQSGTKGFVYTVKCFLNQALSAEKVTIPSEVLKEIIEVIDQKSNLLNDFDEIKLVGKESVLDYATELLGKNESDIDIFNELITLTNNAKLVVQAFREKGYNYAEIKREFEHTYLFFDKKDLNIINHIEIMN